MEDRYDVPDFDGKVIKVMDVDTVEESQRFLNLWRP
jgi:hypothetical protein